MIEPFERHVDEQLRIRITAIDGDGVRQSFEGCEDLSFSIYRQNAALTPIVQGDHEHCVIEEVNPATAGDLMYDAPPRTVPERGRYWGEFLGTIDGVQVAFPQQGYIPLLIT